MKIRIRWLLLPVLLFSWTTTISAGDDDSKSFDTIRTTVLLLTGSSGVRGEGGNTAAPWDSKEVPLIDWITLSLSLSPYFSL